MKPCCLFLQLPNKIHNVSPLKLSLKKQEKTDRWNSLKKLVFCVCSHNRISSSCSSSVTAAFPLSNALMCRYYLQIEIDKILHTLTLRLDSLKLENRNSMNESNPFTCLVTLFVKHLTKKITIHVVHYVHHIPLGNINLLSHP